MEKCSDKAFAGRLGELISKRLKITQSAFAQKIGVSQSFISMVINGNCGPSAGLLAGVYLSYPEHMGWLLTGEETKDPAVRDAAVLFEDIIRKDGKDGSKNVRKFLSFYILKVQAGSDPGKYMDALLKVMPKFNITVEFKDVHVLAPLEGGQAREGLLDRGRRAELVRAVDPEGLQRLFHGSERRLEPRQRRSRHGPGKSEHRGSGGARHRDLPFVKPKALETRGS